MFGILPAYGFYCRHAQGLSLRNLSLRTRVADARPAVVCDDVQDLVMEGVKSSPAAKAAPMVVLSNVRDAWIHSNRVLSEADAFLLLEGPSTSRIRVGDNETSRVKQPLQIGAGVPRGALLLP